MSLRSNLLVNYASHFYASLLGIVFLPLYIRLLGAEAFGLVGFFSTLQALFILLDLGLTPTVARESARFRGGAISPATYVQLIRSLTILFLCIALVGGGGVFAAADVISKKWLNVEGLTLDTVVGAVRIMAICVALRWLGGLYRGVLLGAERMLWLAIHGVVISTLRFAGVLASIAIFGNRVDVFFLHQLAVALIEIVALIVLGYRLMPRKRDLAERISWSLSSIRPQLGFSGTIALTSAIWVGLTQTDKLILSGILGLKEYGYFSLAVLLASGVTMVAGPVSTTLLPRIARLYAARDDYEVSRLYKQAAHVVAISAGCTAIVLLACAESVVHLWTGSSEIAGATSEILRLYAVGNLLMTFSAFPFYLQYARGDLRYHLIGNLVLVVILVPLVIVAAKSAGGVGAGWAWLLTNALYLGVWVAYVHAKLEPGMHWRWLTGNVMVLLPTLLVGCLSAVAVPEWQSRAGEALRIGIIGAACLATAVLTSPVGRTALMRIARVPYSRL